jgi:hypothetical protein
MFLDLILFATSGVMTTGASGSQRQIPIDATLPPY